MGLKPTAGVVGRDPIPEWIDYSTSGPFATVAEDLRLLLNVLRGPAPGDPTALPSWAGPEPSPRHGRVFAVERFTPYGPLPVEVAEPFERAVARFAEVLRVDVERLEPAALFPQGSIDDDWFTICPAEHAHHLGRAWIEANAEALAPATREFLGWGLATSMEDYQAARRRRFEYVRGLDELLGEDGLLLSPVMAVDAGAADGSFEASGPEWYCTPAQNVTGHPALSLPAGTHASGVPFGLQVTGPRFRDELLLDVADRWEAAEPWPRTAPGFDPFGFDGI